MEEFDAYGEVEVSARYNIAPSQPIVTIRRDAREPVRRLSTMRWGLVPSWAKDPGIGYKTINARSGTVATTASFMNRSNRSVVSFLLTGSTSGREKARRNSRPASKLMTVSCLLSLVSGTDGETRKEDD
jgi:putative SOS response-associated peptidase YedK